MRDRNSNEQGRIKELKYGLDTSMIQSSKKTCFISTALRAKQYRGITALLGKVPLLNLLPKHANQKI